MSAPLPATARLAFEPIAAGHAAELAPFLAERALWRFVPRGPPSAADVARRFAAIAVVDRPNGDRWLNWVMRRHADARPVGLLEATVYPSHRAHIAYFVFTPFQRRGYAREGCQALLPYLRAACAVERVDAEVDTRNEASQRLLTGLGFTRDETAQPADPIDDAPAWDYRYRLRLA